MDDIKIAKFWKGPPWSFTIFNLKASDKTFYTYIIYKAGFRTGNCS